MLHVTYKGNLGKDPQEKFKPHIDLNNDYAGFIFGINETNEPTKWVYVKCLGKHKEYALTNLKKGNYVETSGYQETAFSSKGKLTIITIYDDSICYIKKIIRIDVISPAESIYDYMLQK